MVVTGVLCAVSFVLQLLEFPLPFFVPSFIKFDFSDLPALIGSFSLGPVYGIIIELIKNLLHITVSGSFGIGELSNFVLGSVMVFVAGMIYGNHKSKRSAIIASIAGSLAMAVISLPLNYYIVYPIYYNFMPEDSILGAYQAIFPFIKNIFQSLLYVNLPFTLLKGLSDSLICLLIYKPLSPILHSKAKDKKNARNDQVEKNSHQ